MRGVIDPSITRDKLRNLNHIDTDCRAHDLARVGARNDAKYMKNYYAMTELNTRQFIAIAILLVIVSVAASYVHRFLVVDRVIDRQYNLPVITDTVIPATTPLANLVNS